MYLPLDKTIILLQIDNSNPYPSSLFMHSILQNKFNIDIYIFYWYYSINILIHQEINYEN